MADETISKSKQKRIDQKKRAEQAKKEQKKENLINNLIIIVPLAILAVLIGVTIYNYHVKRANTVTASEDFSAMLNDDGTIQGVKTSDYLASFDPASIEIEKDSITYTDAQADSAINQLLTANRTLNDDATAEVADGDTISLDYVGTIDGEEFDGGNTNGAGAELVIGSGSYIDDFEEQLIGSHPGDDVTVDVTFPEDYSTEELAGKDAQFAVHINGIYVTPEFDDAFVAEHYPEYSSAADYRAQLIADHEQDLRDSAISSYISQNLTLDSYPKKYLKHIKELTVTNQMQQFTQQAQMYSYFGITFPYSSYEEYFTTEDKDYTTVLNESAEHTVAANIAVQKLYEDRGLAISEDEYAAYIEENGLSEDTIEYYGKPYIMQNLMREKVIESIRDEVSVVETPDEPEETAEAAEASEDTDGVEETAEEEASGDDAE